ncbi:energy-coupling factor transporter transmembrane protein EcfT [Mycoplasmopsis pullorum]|uniref:energy-coupling factor transporter transmembrane component T family protein n=1 Tax=Mycoplasmopsis pullorum TaxID=48003 RepID=UPI00111838CA|nr:energy-coupling factor transporter transmembrane component T [Mycoplasmopsis pullorum]TNK82434.1 energy-coupling factor transporter transmembrane protein EcfT [Mycoplasmopsis pullorum]TNK91820.1 energy-coupling factor transporter transmembrane protein EcfT [Mycoplasmopsis pullorum]
MKSVFGRYIPGDSYVHKLDPRIKIILTINYIVLTFISSYFIDTLLILLPLVITYVISTKRISPLINSLKFPLFITFFIFIINVYSLKYNDSSYKDWAIPIWKQKDIYITYEAINKTITLFLRIYIMIMVTTLLTNTTKPILLTKAIEDLLLPLKLFFVPVHIIAMIISISLRFIPTLLDEANRIVKAQTSRGVDFKNGKIKEKVVAFTTLIIPLFVSSFSKAEDLSNAMETRGYNPYKKRTRYRKLQFGLGDALVLLWLILLTSFIIINHVNAFDYLPNWYTYYFKIV